MYYAQPYFVPIKDGKPVRQGSRGTGDIVREAVGLPIQFASRYEFLQNLQKIRAITGLGANLGFEKVNSPEKFVLPSFYDAAA